jgi:hypothetical protein
MLSGEQTKPLLLDDRHSHDSNPDLSVESKSRVNSRASAPVLPSVKKQSAEVLELSSVPARLYSSMLEPASKEEKWIVPRTADDAPRKSFICGILEQKKSELIKTDSIELDSGDMTPNVSSDAPAIESFTSKSYIPAQKLDKHERKVECAKTVLSASIASLGSLKRKEIPVMISRNDSLGKMTLSRPVSKAQKLNETSKVIQQLYLDASNMKKLEEDEDMFQQIVEASKKDPSEVFLAHVVDFKGIDHVCSDPEEVLNLLGIIKQKFSDEVKDATNERNVCWIDIEGISFDALEVLGEKLSIHPLTVEDCSHMSGRQKLEYFSEYLFITLASLHHAYCSPETQNFIRILVFDDILLTIHAFPSFAIEVAKTRLKKVCI